MAELRYSNTENYSEADSRLIGAAGMGLPFDPNDEQELTNTDNYYDLTDKTKNVTQHLTDADSGRLVDPSAAIYADFSDNLASVSLTGGGSGDVLIGGAADDVLKGGGGDDMLEGGAGADTFDGGNGFDTVSYANAEGSVSASEIFFVPTGGDAIGDSYTGIESFVGSDFDDTFAFATSVLVEGGGGADGFNNFGNMIVSYKHSNVGVTVDLSGATASTGGDAEGDTFFGVTSLIGSRLDDTLMGAEANDVLKGYGGRDTINGGAGDDTIAVTGAWAAIDGGDGFDRLLVHAFGDSRYVGPGRATLTGIEKVIVADRTQLDLTGQSAIDGSIKLNSKEGSFASVFGTEFNDHIVGGLGHDVIVGNDGRDRISGGAGPDLFAFDSENTARDVILDFSGHDGDGDQISILGGSRAPMFVESFSGEGRFEVRAFTREEGVQIVLIDLNGDGKTDASVRVNSAEALTANDFDNFSSSNVAHADGFAQHPSFAEALHGLDIAGLV